MPHEDSASSPVSTAPAAAWLFRQIASAPSASLIAAIVGPGGTGKSALLDAVSREYEKAGVAVVRRDAASGTDVGTLDPDLPVLVDDAHLLDAAVLAELRARAESHNARIVVAYRQWPRPPGLSALGAVLARRRSPVVLGHLDRSGVAARIRSRTGCVVPESLVELVHEQTGGLPSLVDLVSKALQDAGRYDPRHPERFKRPDRIAVSAGMAERLRYQLEALDPEVYALLQAMAVGAALDADVLGSMLAVEPADLTDTVQAATATGLLTEDGELIPFVRSLVLRLLPVLHSREMQRRLAGIQLDRGGSVLAAGRQLLGTGASGARVATILEAAGDEALRQEPGVAAELFASAVEAGAAPESIAARRAQAIALSGDLDQALRLADGIVADPDALDRQRGISVAAAVLAHRGLPARSAELYRSLPDTYPGGPALAVPALIGIGALAQARTTLDAMDAADRSATLLAGAETLMARGMLASITGTQTATLSQLARASVLLEPAGETVLLPDTPAALTALVALQCGELAAADSALRRAVTAKLGGRPARARHLLLHGWTAMTRGKLDVAHRALNRTVSQGEVLEPRDELFAAALQVGLARREDDLTALSSAWRRARTALVRQPIDLFALQPLGELAVAAARLNEQQWIGLHLEEAENLLDELGNPVLWTTPLRWYQLHAALVADNAPEAQRHAAALAAAAPASPYVSALAKAARSWCDVVFGEVDPETVTAAARRLHEVGLSWEGARLAGHAAARTADRRAMGALLACARALHGDPSPAPDVTEGSAEEPAEAGRGRAAAVAPGTVPTSVPGSDGREPTESRAVLSERELEVGGLILTGLTYKQIGERLFISAKTVEHHVARMRQRLGVGTRNELFGRLRSLIDSAS